MPYERCSFNNNTADYFERIHDFCLVRQSEASGHGRDEILATDSYHFAILGHRFLRILRHDTGQPHRLPRERRPLLAVSAQDYSGGYLADGFHRDSHADFSGRKAPLEPHSSLHLPDGRSRIRVHAHQFIEHMQVIPIVKNHDIRYQIFDGIFYICLFLWLAIQICLVVNIGELPLISDSFTYTSLAEICYNQGSFYPTPRIVENALYVCYPGYVNLLIICLYLFGSVKAIFWINIVCNISIAHSLWRIGRHLVNSDFGKIICLAYIFTPFSSLTVPEALSELPFLCVTLLAIDIACSGKVRSLFITGILLMLAQYIRTTALIFLGGLLIYLILKKANYKLFVSLAAGIVLSIGAILVVNHSLSGGYWFISSTTLGVNMIQGACDGTYGAYYGEVLDDKEIDMATSHLNVFEKDKYFSEKSIDWIKKNPAKWIGYIPDKLYYYFMPDEHLFYGRDQKYFTIDHGDIFLKIRCILPKVYFYGIYLLAFIGLTMRLRLMIRHRRLNTPARQSSLCF